MLYLNLIRDYGLAILCVALWALNGCAANNSAALVNGVRALQAVHAIQEAEARYYTVHGRFGDLSALGPSGAGLVDKALASGGVRGYEFHVEVTASGYRLTAWPMVEGKTGYQERRFCRVL